MHREEQIRQAVPQATGHDIAQQAELQEYRLAEVSQRKELAIFSTDKQT